MFNAFTQMLPAGIALDRGLREGLAESPERRVEIFTEYLDVPRFTGTSYARTVATFLHEKYLLHPPAVVVVTGEGSLEFVLANRALIFPHTPIVHMAMSTATLSALPALPSDVVGVPVKYDSLRAIELAIRLRTSASRLVLVTGASQWDRAWETRLRSEAASFPPGLKSEFLAGLPMDAVRKRLAELGKDAVVFTPGFFEDANGRTYTPRESVQLIAAAAAAPVFGPYETFIGTGVVGGYMPSYEAIGREAGRAVNALLDGVSPESLALPTNMPVVFNADWRQVRRWGLNENAIPNDAVVLFREPSIWVRYRWQFIAVAIAIVLQSLLIATLLFERRRRHVAEQSAQRHHVELSHALRLATVGEMTAAISHEINQPLGAILSNADAAEILLDSDSPSDAELRQILADIRRDDIRASEVIRRIRELLQKHDVEKRTLDMNDLVDDTVGLAAAEASRRGVVVEVRGVPTALRVYGDRVQLQQLLLNLIVNAFDAMAQTPAGSRRLTLSVMRKDKRKIEITVRDTGPGIEAGTAVRLFESFFTTKPKGMGLGLSIARTIAEAHGGNIQAENDPSIGAIFRVTLPEAQPEAIDPQGSSGDLNKASAT